jgi:hypothetical protein
MFRSAHPPQCYIDVAAVSSTPRMIQRGLMPVQAKHVCALSVAMCVLAHDWQQAAQVRGTLSDADMADAIALGSKRDPDAYLLRHDGPVDNPVVVGLIYSPFLRVAFFTNLMVRRSTPLEASNIDSALLAPVVDIAFRWYCCDEFSPGTGAEFDPFAGPEPEVFAVPPPLRATGALFNRQDLVRPLRISKGMAALRGFGAEPPYRDIVLVATFPVSTLRPDWAFVIWKRPSPARGSARIGVIRPSDWERWR